MTKRLLHSYGAIQCLEKLLGMLAEGGFILVNDYGQTQITRDDEFEHQRFSLATFVGVNFSLLRTFFGHFANAMDRVGEVVPMGHHMTRLTSRWHQKERGKATAGSVVVACAIPRVKAGSPPAASAATSPPAPWSGP